jgi:hypothetical protein
MDLPTLFNVGDRQSRWVHLRLVEEMGLDTAQFWRHLYYRVCPEDYPRALKDNAVNFLLSGIRAATMTNLVGTAMFVELAAGLGGDCATALQGLLRTRFEQGAVITICEETYATDDYLSLCEGVLNRPILKDSNHAGHGTKSESALSSLPPGGVALHHHG